MKIEILGTGCPKCKKLEQMVKDAVDELGLTVEVEKVTDINDIIGYGVMLTPALVKDGEVMFAGKLPSKKEIVELLK